MNQTASSPATPSRIAVVTGGSRGLGRNAALHLARDGAGVILTYVSNQAAARQTVAEIEATGARGIAVNTVAPGAIETDFGGARVRDERQLNAFVASQSALGRAGRADDIGAAIASLVKPENGWINAQRIEISGGVFV